MSSTYKFSCPHCEMNYEKSKSLRQHLKRTHGTTSAEPSNRCNELECSKSFFKIDDLRKHLKEDHGFQMSFEEFQFESMDEFEAWKKNVEQESNVRFVKVTGQ
jgi:hypothetical protein